MTNYTKGRAFEYEVKKFYEDKGYTVFRTAGSHGLVDIIAIASANDSIGLPLLIQCKKYKRSKPKPEQAFILWKVVGLKLWATKKKGQIGFDIQDV